MGRPIGKASKLNRYWSKEEKLRIVLRVINHEDSLSIISEQKILMLGNYTYG